MIKVLLSANVPSNNPCFTLVACVMATQIRVTRVRVPVIAETTLRKIVLLPRQTATVGRYVRPFHYRVACREHFLLDKI